MAKGNPSDLNIVTSSARLIFDNHADKLIDSEIRISDNIKQKIATLNDDYRLKRDNNITQSVEYSITSLTILLHKHSKATKIKGGKASAPEVDRAYRALDIGLPGVCFELLGFIAKQYNDKQLASKVYSLKRMTKNPGDTVRHTNLNIDGPLEEIADTYNDVVNGIANILKINSLKLYLINKSKNGSPAFKGYSALSANICPICGKSIKTPDGLKNHILQKHGNNNSNSSNNDFSYKGEQPKKSKPHYKVQINYKKASKFRARFFISLAAGIISFIALILVLTLAYQIDFVTALWVSAIVFYGVTSITYECFKEKLGYVMLRGTLNAVLNISKSIHEDYGLGGGAKAWFYFLVWVFLFPLMMIPVCIGVVIVSAVLYPFILIYDFITRNDMD